MNNRTHSIASFSLVEITLALGVAAFCLIAILGLLPAGVNTNQASVRQTTANGVLSAIVADLRATPVTSSRSTQFGISMNGSTTLCCDGAGRCSTSSGGSGGDDDEEEGGGSGSQCANAIFYATVKFSGSGDEEEGGSGTSFANVKVFWPYSAAAAAAAGGGDNDEEGGGSTQSAPAPAGIVETFVGLDRNGSGSSGGDD